MRRRATTATLVFLLAGCADVWPAVDEIRCFELVESTRFGDAEVVADGLDQRTINAGAGVLGNIRGFTRAPDGSLWVLDRSWQKIVVFGPDGTFERVVLGGGGQGPGEFVIPQDLASGPFGVSALDYDLRRFTFFDWSGELLRVVTTPESRSFRHLIQGDTMWVVPFHSGGARTGPFVIQRRMNGEWIEDGPSLDPVDQPYGIGYGITQTEDGRILVSTARPGVWMEYNGGSWTRKGTARFPDDLPPVEEQVGPQQIRVTPSQYHASGIAVLGDSLVLQAMLGFPEPFDWDNPPERGSERYSLLVFDRAGKHLDTMELPGGVDPSRLHVDQETGQIFITASDPFPQVLSMELVAC